MNKFFTSILAFILTGIPAKQFGVQPLNHPHFPDAEISNQFFCN